MAASLADMDNFFSSPRWLRTKALLKRTLNEGFGSFALSIVLFTVGLCLLRSWWLDRLALQRGIREQILATVETAQEPTDANETGLIAAALANINKEFQERCGPADGRQPCRILERFHRSVAESLNRTAADFDEEDGGNVRHYPISAREAQRPEFGKGPLCEPPAGESESYLLMPLQMADFGSSARIKEGIALSSAFDQVLAKYRLDAANRPLFDTLAQVYFISPDSVLRIWSKFEPNVCKDFSPTKLWASKNYFAYFWDHPDKKSFTTPTYIDYGGNGLVQTRCEEVDEESAGPRDYQHGKLLGIVCVDFQSEQEDRLWHDQLFFETAMVTFPESYDPYEAKVELKKQKEEDKASPQEETSQAPKLADASMDPGGAGKGAGQAQRPAGSTPPGKKEDPAVTMQRGTLRPEDVEQALKEIKEPGPALRRDITHVPFHRGTAFLIPLGPPSGPFRAVFFYPRSPGLGPKDLWFQALGFAAVGAALAAAALGSRLRTNAAQLRERLSLLRSMQIAFLQVDRDDWVLEANDRAEELFQRQLPKPGVTRRKVNFRHLIGARLVEANGAGDGGAARRYAELTTDDILRLRRKGEASSYYARLSAEEPACATQPAEGRKPKWLRISATPMMNLHEESASLNSVQLGNISANAYEAPADLAAQLEECLRELREPPAESPRA